MIFSTSSSYQCCCFREIRHVCFAASLYTIILYSLFALVASFHINEVLDDITLLSITIILCAFSICMIITSLLLIIGLCSENSSLFLPWIISLLITTFYELIITVYLLIIRSINPLLLTLSIIDFIVCFFNLYCTFYVCSLYFHFKRRICNMCSCYKCKCSQIEQSESSGNITTTSNRAKSSQNESSENCNIFTDVVLFSTSKTNSSVNLKKQNIHQ